MSERIVSDPSQHGWIDLGNGKLIEELEYSE